MEYFTQRHGMRRPIAKTSEITIEKYALILQCCEKYYDNIAWKYPELCPDGNACCGINLEALSLDMKYEIPSLFRNDYGIIDTPQQHKYIFEIGIKSDDYDQFALLDFIEFISENVRDISRKAWHGFFKHYDIFFSKGNSVFSAFRNDINGLFQKTGLLYVLTIEGLVERVLEDGVLDATTENLVTSVPEAGVQELLKEAIYYHKSPHPQDHKLAVEKIWDALERLKTYYSELGKKKSSEKIVNDIAGGKAELITMLTDEFKCLTTIGNTYRIRHHETNKIDITDSRYYDYLFNRCLSLISLAVQYLK